MSETSFANMAIFNKYIFFHIQRLLRSAQPGGSAESWREPFLMIGGCDATKKGRRSAQPSLPGAVAWFPDFSQRFRENKQARVWTASRSASSARVVAPPRSAPDRLQPFGRPVLPSPRRQRGDLLLVEATLPRRGAGGTAACFPIMRRPDESQPPSAHSPGIPLAARPIFHRSPTEQGRRCRSRSSPGVSSNRTPRRPPG
jgi:hypothetical protein